MARISSSSPEVADLLGKVDATLTYVWYLASAHSLPLSGKLIRPDSLFGSLLGELTKTVFAGGRLRAEKRPGRFGPEYFVTDADLLVLPADVTIAADVRRVGDAVLGR